MRECASLEEEVRCYGDEIEELRPVFDTAWDEQIQRVYAEQEVFQSQVRELLGSLMCVRGMKIVNLPQGFYNRTCIALH